MPFIRLREIREMSPEKRGEKLAEFRTELSRLKSMVKAGGAIENPSRIREIKRAIARILTVENEEKNKIKGSEKSESP
jgi:large subunit ribosomal protein L29